ncbi:MAG TPA: hypothetical protein DCE41_30585 [Cytophagales bacterium]|nr:hypothetical protein [Cytophagales bacterium]HAA24373.1 hypothetical protein [Cytophagales bacterium]HAP61923.1 hypothetical protein [Cytophagales bacterium]
MFLNSLKVAWRNIRQQPGYTVINLLGLALGLTTSVFILLWVRDERATDTFHPEQDRFYRVMEHQRYGDGATYTFTSTPGALKQDLMDNFPEVELASRYGWPEQFLLQIEAEEGFYYDGRRVDAEFLQLIGVDLLHGNMDRCLQDQGSVVLTVAVAESLFGTAADALGKVIRLNEDRDLEVSGVLDDLPENTSFGFDFLISWHDFEQEQEWFMEWGNNSASTFLRLSEGADPVEFDAKFANRVHDFNENSVVTLFIHPVSDMNLYNRWEEGVLVGGTIETVRIFTLVAFFILVIACINFMNLATARATRRGKEVGLRKVIGAVRGQLIRQFMGESFLMTVLAAVLAAALVIGLMPYFNEVTSKDLGWNVLDSTTLLSLVGILVVTSILAGSYPAFFLSHFRPAQVLKGQQNRGKGAAAFRRVLVIVQFSLSILLLVGTVVVFQQLEYLQTANIGYQRENLIEVPMQGEMRDRYVTMRDELMANPGVVDVAASRNNPTNIGNSTWSVVWEGKDPESRILFTTFVSDLHIPQTLGMELVAGRFPNDQLSTDSVGFILNEKAAAAMGFTPEEAIDQPLTVWGGKEGTIIGVVKDFHFQSLRQEIDPLIVVPDDFLTHLYVRAASGATDDVMESLKQAFAQYAPAYPFDYSFLDEDWEALYRSEEMISQIAQYFAALALVISLLGLFGLAAYTAEQRTKEIGVRKILGASVPQLLVLMSRNFVALVGISALIGCGVGYWLMEGWLDDFAFRVPLKITLFLGATGLTLLVALATVSVHAFRSATTNPVKSLKHE